MKIGNAVRLLSAGGFIVSAVAVIFKVIESAELLVKWGDKGTLHGALWLAGAYSIFALCFAVWVLLQGTGSES